MSESQTIQRMMAAGVPRSCWNVSTTGTGRARYRDFAGQVGTRLTDREQQTVAHVYGVRTGEPVDALEMEILAKELVLANVPTRYITFHKFMRDLRVNENLDPSETDNLSRIYARGAFVLPSIPYAVEGVGEYRYLEAVEYLVNHVYEGGVLALGAGRPERNPPPGRRWPSPLERLLTENSRAFEVQQ